MIDVDRILDVHLLPHAVNDVLGDAAGTVGSSADGAHAFVLHRQSLLLWRVEEGLQAVVRRLTLPEVPSGRLFVEVVPHRQSSAVTVVACTGGGQLHVWLDANFPAAPFSQRLCTAAAADEGAGGQQADAIIVALVASAADGGAGPGFVAAVATADAALHLYHGSQQGIFPRQFHRPAGAGAGVLQAGVLGAIGSAVRALYEEAFDPLHNLQRAGGSCTPALQMQLLEVDAARWKLLVLTQDALDCWLLGSVGQQSTEALLWSFNLRLVLSGQLGSPDHLDMLAMAASASQGPAGGGGQQDRSQQPALYVWSAHTDPAALARYQHTLTCFALEEGTTLPRLLASAALGLDAALPQPQQRNMRWALAAHPRAPSCLALAPNGSVLEWLWPAGTPRLLGSSPDNLAISSSGSSSSAATGSPWQLLNAKYGVLEFSAADGAAAPSIAGTAVSMTAEQVAAARALLQKAVGLMHKEYAAGYPYRELATGLGPALAGLGVLSSEEGRQLLLDMSSSLVDSLPKAGTLASSHLRSMLADKQARHGLLLAALQEGDVLRRLPHADAAVLLQHAQMLAAAADVLQWQRDNEAEAGVGGDADAAQQEAVLAAAAAIKAAGRQAAAGRGEAAAGADKEWEAFFGRPTVSIPALFNAVAADAATIRQTLATAADSSSSLAVLTAQLLGLCGVLHTASSGAEAMAEQLKAGMPDEARQVAAEGPSWLAGQGPSYAWAQLAEACSLAQHDLTELPRQLQLARQAHLPALTALLDGMAATLQHQARRDGRLQEAYERLPWEHGAVLLKLAEREVGALRESGDLRAAAEANEAGDYGAPGFQAAKQALVWPLQELAVHHRCHQLLYEVCDLVEDMGLMPPGQLRLHMAREMVATGGELAPGSFTYYVMQRLFSEGHMAELLALGQQEFQQQLQQFLADRPGLLWMSQVQAGDLPGAAHSLARAAATCGGSVLQANRLLCLTKLAARAAGPQASDSEQIKAAAMARLAQLALQSDVMPGRDAGAPLTTQQLARAALDAASGQPAGGAEGGLAGADAAVAAVEALALDPEQQATEGYRQLWNASWLAALQHTPLQQLAAQGAADAAQRWQSDAYRAAVESCAVYQAFVRAAAALTDAQQRLAAVSPHQELEGVANALLQEAQRRAGTPEAVACLQDVLHAAARRSGFASPGAVAAA